MTTPRTTRVGHFEIVGFSDGSVSLPPSYYAGVDWSEHAAMLSPSGTIERPIGCFLVTGGGTRTLVDVGLGPRRLAWATGGQLPGALLAAGVAPESIDRVVCTHVHVDHVGWLLEPDHRFERARIAVGEAEFDDVMARPESSVAAVLARLRDRDRLDLLRDGEIIAPGMVARATPGHTPGHMSIVVGSASPRAYILGDAVISPEEIGQGWTNTSDADPAVAAATRERLWADLERSGDVAVGAHFPDHAFGRIERRASRPTFIRV